MESPSVPAHGKSLWQVSVNAQRGAEVAIDETDGGELAALFAKDNSGATVATLAEEKGPVAMLVDSSDVPAVEEDRDTFVSMIAYSEGALGGLGTGTDDDDTAQYQEGECGETGCFGETVHDFLLAVGGGGGGDFELPRVGSALFMVRK